AVGVDLDQLKIRIRFPTDEKLAARQGDDADRVVGRVVEVVGELILDRARSAESNHEKIIVGPIIAGPPGDEDLPGGRVDRHAGRFTASADVYRLLSRCVERCIEISVEVVSRDKDLTGGWAD